MTSQQILQSDFLDILFEKRNKTYGAYFLRRHYNEHMVKALGTTALLLAALFFFTGSNDSSSATRIEMPPDLNVIDLVVPPEKAPEPVKPKVQQPAAQKVQQVEYTNQIKVVNNPVDPMATQNSMLHATIGNQTIDGSPAIGVVPPPIEPQAGGEGQQKAEAPPLKEPLPSRQPQFPGGSQAWLNFLNTYLHAPQDLEPGEKRTVMIRFAVDEEGAITNFQVVQSGGSSFDQEVIRVLKKMPRWLPAIQNGKPVAVSFTQPVTFFGQE